MKSYLLIIPVALLVACSRIIVKWRGDAKAVHAGIGIVQQLLIFLSDPLIISAYASAMIGAFVWLFVVTNLTLVTAFLIFIGVGGGSCWESVILNVYISVLAGYSKQKT